jgi:hypothetical protein
MQMGEAFVKMNGSACPSVIFAMYLCLSLGVWILISPAHINHFAISQQLIGHGNVCKFGTKTIMVSHEGDVKSLDVVDVLYM